ncbi:MAG: transcription-repair coupling factor [Bdellovibrionales bacterium]|nr:transcription-repair coupling factor [Bdellovibrionales bacterium]
MRNQLDEWLSGKNQFQNSLTHPLPMQGVAFYLALSKKRKGPHLVITENLDEAKDFMEAFHFWSDQPIHLLPPYEPSVYAGVQLSEHQVHDRLKWLFNALNENDSHVFVAPILGLLQKTLPEPLFMENSFEFCDGDPLPNDIFSELRRLGYHSTPIVEDPGSFANRGGIVDIFSPQMEHPVRIELFGNEIESLRSFDPATQRTLAEVEKFTIIPAREVLLNEKNAVRVSQKLLSLKHPDLQILSNHLRRQEYCENLEFHLPLFYDECSAALDYFHQMPTVWMLQELNIETSLQKELSRLQSLFNPEWHTLKPENLFADYLKTKGQLTKKITVDKLQVMDSAEAITQKQIEVPTKVIRKPRTKKFHEQIEDLKKLLLTLVGPSHVVISVRGQSQFDRIRPYLESSGYICQFVDQNFYDWDSIIKGSQKELITFVPRKALASFFIPSEGLSLISFEHFFGKQFQSDSPKATNPRGKHLSFGEITEGDYVVHSVHGVCQFTGLKTMPVAGVEGEFLTLQFKGKDKLFLPIYRIHQIYKYASERVEPSLDKLGSSKFQNVKTKTKRRLREIAHELVRLYAQRKNTHRPSYSTNTEDVFDFFNAFPYDETDDQMTAIEDIVKDLNDSQPMDRLICGDVGFGKTEVAMRAAFVVASNRKQVAVLAPTTVLTMQHLNTFKKRFRDWPLRIEVINRLIPTQKAKEIIEAAKKGDVDILIGTHRLLSQDVGFKELGLLIVDEEQKFGVKHKEKIKQLKVNVDTLAMSATPIPRTLNMSLLGIRDLSLINTAPVDRLETRTFICRFDKEIIRRAVESELERGGQVFFLHNKVQSIYAMAEELRALLPKVRIGVGHGQLKEKELESVMVSFFNNDLDILLCSTIIESGVDIPNANTMLINSADKFGLSQLYQLRGRVGRSGRRAYCYLLTDPNRALTDIAKERLRVIQENTALGSGIQIANYDLELRGAGTLLGEEQSGLVDTVGYEFYMDLLEEAVAEAKGEDVREAIEPEINLKIKAFIPSTYISNIRLRLAYYRALTQIQNPGDIDALEEELTDQFGKPPIEVINLLGIMLVRHACIQLGVKDISSGKESLVLAFTDQTPLPTQKVIELASMSNKKYSITPENRLKIRLKDISWPKVYDEVELLLKYCP